MRSLKHGIVAAVAMMVALLTHLAVAQSDQRRPNEADVQRAVDALRADPNLADERTTRTLDWIGEDDEPTSSGANWFNEFAGWIAESARVLMWVVIALLLLLIIRVMVRQFRNFERAKRPERPNVPTHVRDLDIRPESLPDDVGDAALALWRQGEHRGALSLLYRGLLSRLVHAHAVPIKASSTEGECVQLAQAHLQPATGEYVVALIQTWQRAIYGARDPHDDELVQLCSQFDRALGPAREVTSA